MRRWGFLVCVKGRISRTWRSLGYECYFSEFKIHNLFLFVDAGTELVNYTFFFWYPISWKFWDLKITEKAGDKGKKHDPSYFASYSHQQWCRNDTSPGSTTDSQDSFFEHSHRIVSKVPSEITIPHPLGGSPSSIAHLLTEGRDYKHPKLILFLLLILGITADF